MASSQGVAKQIVGLGWNYFSQIKSEHGEIHREAVRALSRRKTCTADFNYTQRQKGDQVTYHVWQYDLSDDGWLDWGHARQLVRVQRTVVDSTGKETVGNRYYVSSLTPAQLSPTNAATISRGHWRCEEETHWTSDAQLNAKEAASRSYHKRSRRGSRAAASIRTTSISTLTDAASSCPRDCRFFCTVYLDDIHL